MSDGQRHSIADQPSLINDPVEEAKKEAENAVAQIDRVMDMIDDVVRGGRPFRLRPSMILDLHRVALDGLDAYAGNFRPGDVEIGKSNHQPPKAHLVAGLVEELCDYVNEQFLNQSALHLCAYVMWRLNWIHPFTDGNGRTSRAAAYYVLCARVGDRLAGDQTVPEQIAADRQPYYNALESADGYWRNEDLNLSDMEDLLGRYLANQLLSTYQSASDPDAKPTSEKKFH
jgi:Fic family protein